MMPIGVVTVTFNAADHLLPFLECCMAQQPGDFELVVIDNASSDASVDMVRRLGDARVHVVVNDSNVGYAAACNRGVRLLMDRDIGDILLINNDTVFEPRLFSSLAASRRTHRADAVTPRLTYFPGTERNWYAGGRFVFWKGFQGEHLGEGDLHVPGDDAPRWTEVAPGCCVLFDAAVFKRIGGFDESYFVYYEDTDFFLRMKRAGMRLLYAPGITLAHKVSLSTGGSQSAFSIRYYQRNQVYLLRKHFGFATLCMQLLILCTKALLRLALRKDSSSQTAQRLRAIREGLRMPLDASKRVAR